MFSIRMVAYWDDLGWTASSNLIQMPWQGDPKAKEDAGPAAWLGKPMVFSKIFSWNCMDIWKLKSRCSSISWFFGSRIFPHVFPKDFYYNYYILSHGFFLKKLFWSVIFLRNFQGISHHFTGTLWIFQFVAEAVFPIISLEPYEFSNL